MSKFDGTGFDYNEYFCPICKKDFIAVDRDSWAYRSGPGGMAKLFCSWSCLQKWRNGRGNLHQRREKIKQALEDGLTVSEIAAMLGEDNRNIIYWKNKMEKEKEGKNDA